MVLDCGRVERFAGPEQPPRNRAMNRALIVFTVPEYEIAWIELRERDKNGYVVQVADAYRDEHGILQSARIDAVIKDHPNAFWRLEVPVSALWRPPNEHIASGWEKGALQSQTASVRESLEVFLNKALLELDGKVRTGRFILGTVKARIETCKPLPKKVFEMVKDQLGRAEYLHDWWWDERDLRGFRRSR